MKKIIPAVFAALSLTFAILSAASAADVRPVAIKKSDKCAVCGMFVSEVIDKDQWLIPFPLFLA